MLKRFRIKNFYSILDEVELDMEKGNYMYRDEMINDDVGIVNPIGIYGLNGSGKTTILKAIYFISCLMYQSNSSKNKSLILPYILKKDFDNVYPFSEFRFELNIDGVNYLYELVHDIIDEMIIYEKLTNLDTEYCYFVRESKKYFYKNIERKVEGDCYPVLRALGKDSLNDDNEISKIFDFFENIVYVSCDGRIFGDIIEKNDIMELIVKNSNRIKKIITNYNNFPVYDVIKTTKNLEKQYYLKLEGAEANLPYFFASQGIKSHNRLLSILLELPKNSLILIDEMEHNLHPVVAQQLLQMMNKLSIQCIFTSHNTNLLQKMRPDQIIFAKWVDNKSKYNKLSKIYPNIRNVNNIEKMYLGGLFEEK